MRLVNRLLLMLSLFLYLVGCSRQLFYAESYSFLDVQFHFHSLAFLIVAGLLYRNAGKVVWVKEVAIKGFNANISYAISSLMLLILSAATLFPIVVRMYF